jgi:C-terminal processing protease CtpA/Prc
LLSNNTIQQLKHKSIVLFLLCLFFAYSNFSIAQKVVYNIDKKYSPEQLKQDLDVLEKRLKHFHPDPYHYITKDSLHLYVEKMKNQITDSLNEFQFRFYVRQIIAKIGCGHTAAVPSKQYTKNINALNRPMFPANLWILDSNKLFVKQYVLKDKKLQKGDEILSINGNKPKDIIEKMYSTFSSDGLNTTYKKQNLSLDRFKYFYAAAYKPDSIYALQVRTLKGDTQNIEVNHIGSKVDTLKLYAVIDKSIIYRNSKAKFKIDTICKNLAILDIDNFAGKKWRKVIRKSFKYLKAHPEITNLAIDLRDNGGGKVGKGTYLLTYLLPKAFSMPFGRTPNLLPFNPIIKMSFGSRLTILSFGTYPISWLKKDRWTHYFFALPRKRNHFNGNVYVITNGRSFSMSGVTASYLKFKAGAKTIGEETGGTQTGSNAMISGRVILPNTGSIVQIPLYHLNHAINVPDTKRGLMPDYPINYSVFDKIMNKDKELEKLRKICK